MVKINRLVQKSLSLLITLYRYLISPVLGQHCRFYPSCSVYAKTAIEELGVVRGLFYATKRLLCCHPWHPGGIDPVPTQTNRILEK